MPRREETARHRAAHDLAKAQERAADGPPDKLRSDPLRRDAALTSRTERLVELTERRRRTSAETELPLSYPTQPAAPAVETPDPAEARHHALNDAPLGDPAGTENASPTPSDPRVRRLGAPEPTAAAVAGPAAATPDMLGTPGGRAAADPFWQVWLAHRDHLRRQSLRLMSGNMADAEDALSAAMLKASQKFADYADSIVNERAWLSRLLHNACMDVYRMQRKQARWISEQPSEDELEASNQPVVPTERSPEDLALSREQLSQLQDQVVQLPASLRRPFLMRFVQNLSYDEIAAELKLTNAAVRKRIQLARERLRRGLNW